MNTDEKERASNQYQVGKGGLPPPALLALMTRGGKPPFPTCYRCDWIKPPQSMLSEGRLQLRG